MEDSFINNLKKMHLGEEKVKETEKSKSTFSDFSIGKSQIESIREAVTEINRQLKDRDILKDSTIKRLDAMKSDFVNLLMQKQSELRIEEQIDLMNKAIEVEKLKLQEELNAWRDNALLKKELREHLKEMRELELKSEEIEGFLK